MRFAPPRMIQPKMRWLSDLRKASYTEGRPQNDEIERKSVGDCQPTRQACGVHHLPPTAERWSVVRSQIEAITLMNELAMNIVVVLTV
jgi:hypothetical protein